MRHTDDTMLILQQRWQSHSPEPLSGPTCGWTCDAAMMSGGADGATSPLLLQSHPLLSTPRDHHGASACGCGGGARSGDQTRERRPQMLRRGPPDPTPCSCCCHSRRLQMEPCWQLRRCCCGFGPTRDQTGTHRHMHADKIHSVERKVCWAHATPVKLPQRRSSHMLNICCAAELATPTSPHPIEAIPSSPGGGLCGGAPPAEHAAACGCAQPCLPGPPGWQSAAGGAGAAPAGWQLLLLPAEQRPVRGAQSERNTAATQSTMEHRRAWRSSASGPAQHTTCSLSAMQDSERRTKQHCPILQTLRYHSHRLRLTCRMPFMSTSACSCSAQHALPKSTPCCSCCCPAPAADCCWRLDAPTNSLITAARELSVEGVMNAVSMSSGIGPPPAAAAGVVAAAEAGLEVPLALSAWPLLRSRPNRRWWCCCCSADASEAT